MTGSIPLIEVTARAMSPASPEVLFANLKDGATWPRWTMFDAFELERPGAAEPMGLGAIRVFSTRVSRAREQVTELIEGRRLAYELLSGFPLSPYRAEVELTPAPGGGTAILWRSRFAPRRRAEAWFWRLFIGGVLRRAARDLARSASA